MTETPMTGVRIAGYGRMMYLPIERKIVRRMAQAGGWQDDIVQYMNIGASGDRSTFVPGPAVALNFGQITTVAHEVRTIPSEHEYEPGWMVEVEEDDRG